MLQKWKWFFSLAILFSPFLLWSQQDPNQDVLKKVQNLQNRIYGVNQQLSNFNTTLESQDPTKDKAKMDRLKSQVKNLQSSVQKMIETITQLSIQINNITNNSQGANQLKDTQRILSQIEATLNRLENSTKTINQEIVKIKPQSPPPLPPSTMEKVMDQSKTLIPNELKTGAIDIKEVNKDSVKIKITNDILFKSGEVSLSPQGQETIKKIAQILTKFQDKDIFIIGHTDKAPPAGDFRRIFPTNWELSVARGVMVTRFLIEELGSSPLNITAGGRSFYEPLSETDYAKNRRTEIWIFPHIQEKDMAPSNS